ncbi:PAAR-like protein [Niabella aurantiaca]|uniref:PAAR-like protein n=1 Tax=Niabella aurantiaca TaxID=379900 RepID=UPI00037B559A|nr:PAAR-like protein [Niabella aurantiaca]
MKNRNYVIDGGMVKCSLGTALGKIKATSQQKIYIGGKLKITDQDTQLVLPCGTCNRSSLPPPCTPRLQYWKNTSKKATMGNKRFVMDDSYTQCSFGGILTIQQHAQEASVRLTRFLAGSLPGLSGMYV